MEKNFGHLLIEGKFWAKNTYNENFLKLYDYPFSMEGFKYFNTVDKKKIVGEIKNLKKALLPQTLKNMLYHK